jgi:hypothetical protein
MTGTDELAADTFGDSAIWSDHPGKFTRATPEVSGRTRKQ